MNEQKKIPEIISQAYEHLVQCRIVEINEPLSWKKLRFAEGWNFRCEITVPFPNKENIPEQVILDVLIYDTFPFSPVDFFPIASEVMGFTHQDAESGKLCLPEERLVPRNYQRLVNYIRWAKEWLFDAANNNLVKQGDPYELPDFSRKLLNDPFSKKFSILFSEDEFSFTKWKDYIGNYGTFECYPGKCIPAFFANRFFDKNNRIIWEPRFSATLFENKSPITGFWILLKDIRYYRHRPAQTYEELNELCINNQIQFYDVLKEIWKSKNGSFEFNFILIGFPIPKFFGQDNKEIHWQPLIIKNLNHDRKKLPKPKTKKTNKLWNILKESGRFNFKEQLPWGSSNNINLNRLYVRGAYSKKIHQLKFALFGCGALGSVIAELLCRGGINNISLFDHDYIQMENFCRHSLDGRDLDNSKAKALANKLSTINPFANIIGYSLKIPFDLNILKDASNSINESEILIDCTTSESAFDWLNQYAKKHNKCLISLFFNFHAELLTLCISSEKNSCGEIFHDLIYQVVNEKLPVESENYLHQPSKEEQIIEGAGCWHPTFPALNLHIQILAASAVEIITNHLDNIENKGLAVLIRRNKFEEYSTQSYSLIEVLWKKIYQ